MATNNKIETIYERFFELLNSGNYTADEIAEKIITEFDSDPESLKEAAFEHFMGSGIEMFKQAETGNTDDAISLYEKAEIAFQKATDLKPDFSDAYYNWGSALCARAKLINFDEELYLQGIAKFEKAIEYRPDHDEAYINIGSSYKIISDYKSGSDKLKLLEKAIDFYKKSLNYNSVNDITLFNLGTTISQLAVIQDNSSTAEELIIQAFGYFKQALDSNPHRLIAVKAWGEALNIFADLKNGDEDELDEAASIFLATNADNKGSHPYLYQLAIDLARKAQRSSHRKANRLYTTALQIMESAAEFYSEDSAFYLSYGKILGDYAEIIDSTELFKECMEKLEKCSRLNPGQINLHNNTGVYLVYWGRLKSGNEKIRLYEKAFKEFEKEIKLFPKNVNPYQNWASFLSELARESPQEKAGELELYEKAFKLYEQAVRIDEYDSLLYVNWGHDLSMCSQLKEGDEIEKYEQLALEKYKKGVDLGGSTYNYACFLAGLNRKEEALKYLDKALANYEVTPEYATEDIDFEEFYSDKDFLEIIEKHSKSN